MHNKFNSNLQVNDVVNDIYAFGQRFEYEYAGNAWSVYPKYKDLKDEALNNKLCRISVRVYYEEYANCNVFMSSERIRDIQRQNPLKPLTSEHMLSLLMYCDCDKYQNEWSGTFRRMQGNESDISLKRRHSHFYHSSKNLREMVEEFGSSLIDKENKHRTFYHGVSQILYFHRTVTQFNGPLSTSTDCSVALRFSNDVGIILALKYSWSTYMLKAKYFSCSYFSDYPNEKECLFIGGTLYFLYNHIMFDWLTMK